MNGLIVDLFAGGGGASTGIEQALGRSPDIAVNHDAVAVAMHSANHPGTLHFQQDIWDVHPRWATRNRPVGLLWMSPDCTHHSKAKGGPPKRDLKRRSLAWVAEKWIMGTRPTVIILENVEEFKDWGPLDCDGVPIKSQKGTTFCAFLRMLRRYGYKVEYRELRACDYGAPTIRNRLFLIARCDGFHIEWPEPSHGTGSLPYRTASEIIDWSIPVPSIFERKRPLVDNTMRRIAEGLRKYVIEAPRPFIISYYGPKREGDFRGRSLSDPLPTQSAENRFGLVVPHLQRQFGNSIGHAAEEPTGTVTAGGGGKTALVSAFLTKYFGTAIGQRTSEPVHALTGKAKHGLVASHLIKFKGTSRHGQSLHDPLHTVQAGGLHYGAVYAFLTKYFGRAIGQECDSPAHTLTARDRLGLVTVNISGEPYVLADIGLRMLSPAELFRAQGFPEDYIIDLPVNGKRITKADQVRMCGNSVCPDVARSLVKANCALPARKVAL
ncbi:MAG: DNA cytosine methyltransferase [Syntrophobacteraceae bacterium]